MPAVAQSHSNTMLVTASVRAYTQVRMIEQPARIQVTAAARERGYVDVPAAWVVLIRSNEPRGHQLSLAPVALPGVRMSLLNGQGLPAAALRVAPGGPAPAPVTVGARIWVGPDTPAELPAPRLAVEAI
ncbi:hypothetical protein IP84_01360 [beta proteobacterium AAP99]|nr:hypothetical protein IP84_01360 [beta proteobacterium AAP99]